jgi:hypothetical protein
MNFDLENGPPGQAYKLLVGLVAPRPIALITSIDEDGRLNAAPFSNRFSNLWILINDRRVLRWPGNVSARQAMAAPLVRCWSPHWAA